MRPVVNYVRRTLQYIVLDDAEKQGDYRTDPYVIQNRSKSMLCLPVVRQSELMGILYLENTVTPGAFPLDRIEVLQLIAAQAAIALENTTLYANLTKALQAREESEQKYRRLAENVTDNLWVMDLQTLRFSHQSQSVQQMRGYTLEEALALSLEESLPPDSLKIALSVLNEERAQEKRTTAPNRTRKIVIENYCKNGSTIWVEATMRFLRDAEGVPTSILGVSRDITERKKAEEEVHRLNLELEERVERRTAELQESLETLKKTQNQLIQSEKMAALGGLVSGVAHEINTPLGIGLTAASLLQDKTTANQQWFRDGQLQPQEYAHYLKIAAEASDLIYNNLQRAAELVNNFKLVAVDQSTEQSRWFNLKNYLNDMIPSFQPKLRQAGHTIHLKGPDDLSLYSCPGVFYQVFSNLVMNSIIHGFEARTTGRIEIDIRKENDSLLIHYQDNGRGMESNTLKRLYDPFYTTKRFQGCTGLGMHIVYNLVSQSLKGEIQCTSTPGQGVTFLIRLRYPFP